MNTKRLLNALILGVASLIGVASFLYPFYQPPAQSAGGAMSHGSDAPFVFGLLILFCLGAVLGNLESHHFNSKMVAALGILTAVNAVLRAVPGPAGFSAIFFLPLLVGYVFGPTFGFLLGALSLLVSAFIGGGIGPWVPYQMFASGWVGLTSSWLPNLRRWRWAETVMLAAWGLAWGFLFGAVMNLWFWPYVFTPGDEGIYWQPGIGLTETLKRYAAFYALTSLWWDLVRAGGNALLLLFFAAPVVKLLRRFQRRFHFDIG
jgi:energy-coupling factor transport system substrate-specific component